MRAFVICVRLKREPLRYVQDLNRKQKEVQEQKGRKQNETI